MRVAGTASGEEKVRNVAAAERAVGHPPTRDGNLPRRGNVAGTICRVVKVNRPGGDANRVLKGMGGLDITLAHNVVADDAAALALAGDPGHPVEALARVAGVPLCVGEAAVDCPQKTVTQSLGVVDRVLGAASVFHACLPGPVALESRAVPCDLRCPRHIGEGCLLDTLLGRPEKAAAHRLGIGHGWGERFAVFAGGFAPHAIGRAGPETKPAVARAVCVEWRDEPPTRARLDMPRIHGDDAAFLVRLDPAGTPAKVTGNAGIVCDKGRACRVIRGGVGVAVLPSILDGADNPVSLVARLLRLDADFAACVATEHRAVLDKRHG